MARRDSFQVNQAQSCTRVGKNVAIPNQPSAKPWQLQCNCHDSHVHIPGGPPWSSGIALDLTHSRVSSHVPLPNQNNRHKHEETATPQSAQRAMTVQ